jgi:hypothetical protein
MGGLFSRPIGDLITKPHLFFDPVLTMVRGKDDNGQDKKDARARAARDAQIQAMTPTSQAPFTVPTYAGKNTLLGG